MINSDRKQINKNVYQHNNLANSPSNYGSNTIRQSKSTSNIIKSSSSTNVSPTSNRNPTTAKSSKNVYDYPFQPNKNTKSKSPTFKNKCTSKLNQSRQKRKISDVDTADKKQKNLQKVECRIKNYFDQSNTKNELKELTESINSNFDKINNNLMISRESLNTSNISNVFEKNSHNAKYGNFNNSTLSYKRDFSIDSHRRKNSNRDNNKLSTNSDCDYSKRDYNESTPQFYDKK